MGRSNSRSGSRATAVQAGSVQGSSGAPAGKSPNQAAGAYTSAEEKKGPISGSASLASRSAFRRHSRTLAHADVLALPPTHGGQGGRAGGAKKRQLMGRVAPAHQPSSLLGISRLRAKVRR